MYLFIWFERNRAELFLFSLNCREIDKELKEEGHDSKVNSIWHGVRGWRDFPDRRGNRILFHPEPE